MFDVIGDVHGHYTELCNLFHKMGYMYDSARELFIPPPGRTAVFIGDYIDKGRENLKALRLVRAMVEAGYAQAILGNHDVNAVLWTMPRPDKPEKFIRSHNAKHFRQHELFLREAEKEPAEYASHIAWLKTLPLYLKIGDCHFIHACWHGPTLEFLEKEECLTADGRFTEKGWAAGSKKSPYYDAVGLVLCGPEEKLPDGMSYHDHAGTERTIARVAWWRDQVRTYGDALTSIPLTETFLAAAYNGNNPVADKVRADLRALQPETRIFTGHIGQEGMHAPLSDKVCCVDYNAGGGGPLVAYRYNVGDALTAQNFVSVPNTAPRRHAPPAL